MTSATYCVANQRFISKKLTLTFYSILAHGNCYWEVHFLSAALKSFVVVQVVVRGCALCRAICSSRPDDFHVGVGDQKDGEGALAATASQELPAKQSDAVYAHPVPACSLGGDVPAPLLVVDRLVHRVVDNG